MVTNHTNNTTATERIEEIKERIEEIKDRMDAIENNDDECVQQYDDMLDETSGEVVIGTLRYCASRVLKEVDPIAYDIGYTDYYDEELSELYNEKEELLKELDEIGGQ